MICREQIWTHPSPPVGRTTNNRYIELFVRSRCSATLISNKIFPNAKEVTEAYGAYFAASRAGLSLKDPSVNLVAVGDGSTPRVAALFAVRSAWNCWSIDPKLKPRLNQDYPIRRLTLISSPVEQAKLHFDGLLVIMAIHSHARLNDVLKSLTAPSVCIIVMPCCVPQYIGEPKKSETHIPPDLRYRDDGVWSEKNEVLIWKNLNLTKSRK